MKLNNYTLIINETFHQIFSQIRKIYFNSSIYDKKISSKNLKALIYKPSLNILSTIAKYDKTKNKIEDFEIDKILEINKIAYKDYKKLNKDNLMDFKFAIDIWGGRQNLQRKI